MLIEFRVANFRSLKDEQALTMESDAPPDATDPRVRTIACHGKPLLQAAVIFGSNASGKSNLLTALAFMRQMNLHSLDDWFVSGGIPRNSFAWSSKSKEPSLFEVVFESEGEKYQYGFVVDDQRVREEWLFGWSADRTLSADETLSADGKYPVFVRDGSQIQWGAVTAQTRELLGQAVASSGLLVTAAQQSSQQAFKATNGWFRRIRTVNLPIRHPGRAASGGSLEALDTANRFVLPEEGTRLWRLCKEFLRSADLGIVDIKQEPNFRGLEQGTSQPSENRILIRHTEAEDSWLDLEEESEGTKHLLRLCVPVVQTIESGGLLLVDELESSLHPLLGEAIVKVFHFRDSNPRGAQVLFTTHDTRLLETLSDQPLLRRDQIWLAEKDNVGASRIYPLTDYKPREPENLQRGYLQGRYGAIPFCPKINWTRE
jgi:uncharacterized protein